MTPALIPPTIRSVIASPSCGLSTTSLGRHTELTEIHDGGTDYGQALQTRGTEDDMTFLGIWVYELTTTPTGDTGRANSTLVSPSRYPQA